MNRSFSEKQEIDCSCFNFGLRTYSYVQYKQNYPLSYVNSNQQINNLTQSKNLSYHEKSTFKKSLKSKQLNQSTQLDHNKKNVLIKQHRRYPSVFISDELSGKQNQRVIQIEYPLYKKSLPEQNKKIPKINFRSQLVQFSNNQDKQIRQDILQNEKKQQNSSKQLKKMLNFGTNKSIGKKNIMVDLDLQSKTKKNRYSNFKEYKECQQNETDQILQKQNNFFNQIKNLNTVPINAETGRKRFCKRLKSIYLKQIQSFEDQLSQVQSVVIQKGRTKCEPTDTVKFQAFQFISSLHLSNRVSKVQGKPSTQRRSKVMSKNII